MASHSGKSHISHSVDLTEGSIVRGLIAFAVPMFLGQLLQQFYNMTDAWVVGNFASNDAFAAVSLSGNLVFLIIGLFNGIAVGGGVVISRFYGARDNEGIERSIHTNFIFGIIASVISTAVGLIITPHLLKWMNTPDSVMPDAMAYFSIYFGGVSTAIMYNTCMAIMRAVGDSLHPLYYLIVSSLSNVVLDLLFVAVFHWSAAGAALATVIAQALSVVLCLWRMCHASDATRLHLSKLRLRGNGGIMREIIRQGLPTGIQNCVISIGNMVIQANINTFGAYAISGHGAYAKLEGFAFLPITNVAMALPTFVSQNLGAGKWERARRGSIIGIAAGCIAAELLGVIMFLLAPQGMRIFTSSAEAIEYGVIHMRITAFFFCLLAYAHCVAGVMRGCGKSIIPMTTMLICWCGIRIIYVTVALRVVYAYRTIAWAYPLTWGLSVIAFTVCLIRLDWRQLAQQRLVKN